MLILTIGLVAMAQLLAVATRMHADSREASAAAQLTQAQMDALARLPFTSPLIQINAADTLAANTANYFDTPAPGVTRRWSVQAGPVAGTRMVTVRVVNDRGRQFGGQFQATTIIRQW